MKGADTNILDSIVRLTVRYDNVKLLDSMPQDDIYRIYDNSSVVVVPSIYEPTSAVAVEGLMKKRYAYALIYVECLIILRIMKVLIYFHREIHRHWQRK